VHAWPSLHAPVLFVTVQPPLPLQTDELWHWFGEQL
jgi:hypothetical protein